MNNVSIYYTIIIGSVLLFACSIVHANSSICIEGKFDPNKALIVTWGNPEFSPNEAVWDLQSYLSSRPAKKEILENSFIKDFEENFYHVVSIPDKLLSIPSNNSALILRACTRPYKPKISYACSTCSPLLSAQLWHKKGTSWCLVAEDRVITIMGGIGELTYENVGIVKIGPDKVGVLFEDDGGHGGDSIVRSLLLLLNDKQFNIAFDDIIAEGNTGHYGERDFRAYEYSAKVNFIPGSNTEFFDMRIVTSGTNLSKKQKSIPWNREMIYVMKNGHYVLKTNRPITLKSHSKN